MGKSRVRQVPLSRLRVRPWAMAVERALPPVAIGLMAAGVYTVGRAGVTDVLTAVLAIASALVLARGWLPAAVTVLAAGAVSWLVTG